MTRLGTQKGSVLAKVLGFSFGLTLLFTGIANLLPQVEGEAPVEQEIDLNALTMDAFVELGESLFKGKGTCTLCHNAMGRAPDILVLNMTETAIQRMADARYKGTATDDKSYFIESMINPSAYVVKDFGKKGSNDTLSPMPVANKTPISLTDIEMDAIVAYLQNKDGNDITVALPEAGAAPVVEQKSAAGAAPISATSAEDALSKYGCTACHTILDSTADLGPNLTTLASRSSKAEIRTSILYPNEVIAEGYTKGLMPTDFIEKMTLKELEMMTTFLSEQKGSE